MAEEWASVVWDSDRKIKFCFVKSEGEYFLCQDKMWFIEYRFNEAPESQVLRQ